MDRIAKTVTEKSQNYVLTPEQFNAIKLKWLKTRYSGADLLADFDKVCEDLKAEGIDVTFNRVHTKPSEWAKENKVEANISLMFDLSRTSDDGKYTITRTYGMCELLDLLDIFQKV